MAPRERALVIFVGLMRAFERAFPAFRHTLIAPNEQSFEFEIAVATSLTQTCSDKDRKSGCCRADASAFKYVNRTGDELMATGLAFSGNSSNAGGLGSAFVVEYERVA